MEIPKECGCSPSARQMLLLIVGIGEREQMAVFQILAAILHLGSVQVKHQSEDQSRISVSASSLILSSDVSARP